MIYTFHCILTGRVISLVCLVLTFLHYWFTTKFQVLYKKCMMNYLVTLIITNVELIILFVGFYDQRSATFNPLEGYNKYFSLFYHFNSMSTLLWTNVICYDFWRKIKNLKPYNNRNGETRMFIKCSIYVWSCSFLHSTVSFINDNFLIGRKTYNSIKITLFIILCSVFLFNLFMMLHATILIIKATRSIKSLRGANTFDNHNDYKQKVRLYFKLIIGTMLLSTCNWFWFSLSNLFKNTLDPTPLHIVNECALVVNSYQGFFVFVMYSLKKKYVLAFKKKVSDLFSEQTMYTDIHLSMHEDNRTGEKSINGVSEKNSLVVPNNQNNY